jgi:adenine-specific DNA-methyltransferase
MGKYDALTKEELVRLMEARDRREATRFGLVWEAGAEPEAGLNADYVALDLVPELCHGPGPWENLVIEGDNFDALRALRPGYSGRLWRATWRNSKPSRATANGSPSVTRCGSPSKGKAAGR